MLPFDFERPIQAERWVVLGSGSVQHAECLVGGCLQVSPHHRMRLVTSDLSTDWRSTGSLRLRAWSDADVTVDVALTAGRGATDWRQTLEIPGEACVELEIDLGWFRRADGPVVSWAEIRQLELSFRSNDTIWLDDIDVGPGTPSLWPSEIAKVTGGRVTSGRAAAVITGVGELDAAALATHLDGVEQRVRQDLPWLPAVPEPIPLVVTADVPTYRDVVTRLGRAFGAFAAPPRSNGYTVQAIATSSWDEKEGDPSPGLRARVRLGVAAGRSSGCDCDPGAVRRQPATSGAPSGRDPQRLQGRLSSGTSSHADPGGFCPQQNASPRRVTPQASGSPSEICAKSA